MIEIITPGFYSTVQDAGRTGYRSVGVGSSGAMDGRALAVGNAALGNAPDAAAIEITFGGFEIKAHADFEICLAGASVDAQIDNRPISRWWVHTVHKGQSVKVNRSVSGMRCYFCVLGGIDVPQILGSKSTDLKGHFGGVEGRLLQAGDRLNIAGHRRDRSPVNIGLSPRYFPELWLNVEATPTLRFVPAREWDDLDEINQSKFLNEAWLISPASNRVGLRFTGTTLHPKISREMLSHGILPGTLQLPPSGEPVAQMVDANTAGGYPKLGMIIEADLSILAQVPMGKSVRFEICSVQDAIDARDAQHLRTRKIRDLMAVLQPRP